MILGSDIAVDPALNLAGVLSALIDVETASYGVPEHVRHRDGMAALTAYLTAPGFDDARPRVLIWANPVWLNPAQRGARPLQEAIVAARGTCSLAVPVTADGVGGFRARLDGLEVSARDTLMVQLDGRTERQADFVFAKPDGTVLRRQILRHPEQQATDRFLMPLASVWQDGLTTVDLSFDTRLATAPRLTLCKGV